MLTNTRTIRIEWGDCDPAGIVYYPQYFRMFDGSTTALFERALGMTKFQFFKHYDFAGYPMVDTRARFLIPNRFGDDVTVQTTVTEFRRSSFDVQHHLMKGDALSVECAETRVWITREPSDPDKIKPAPVPQDVIKRFKTG